MIAYLQQASAWGAVERYLEQLLEGLDEEAVVIAPRSPELQRLGAHAELRPIEARSAPARFVHLVRELRRLRPRLVHVVDVWPVALLAARLARVPRVIVTHHTPELPRRENLVGRALWALGWLTRPEVIYTSETDRARDGRPRGVVIPLGLELDRFDIERRPHEGRVIGNVARLVEQKDQRLLVEAAPAILGRFPDARFVVVGDGPLRNELERAATGLPFEFTGERDDVPELLAGFDVFAFPSRFEGLCLAVIEAQAVGIPVVATPVGGIRETVVDGETGLLVPVGDAEALARAVSRLLEEPERGARLAAEAQRRVHSHFALANMVHQTFTIYNS
ncbi:MAG: glycosyltransferase family 4 protein [Gaiellaceae bacterium]